MRRIVHPPIAQTAATSFPSARADGVSAFSAFGKILVFALGGLAAAGPAAAVTRDLPIAVDTHLDSRTSDGSDHWNFGADHTDKVVVNSRDDPTSLCRALFRIPEELWAYPPERIISAKVYFYVWQDNSGSRGVTLFPLTSDFAQGTGSKYEQPDPVDGATWWTRDGTHAWTAPGGDFDANFPVAGVKEDILDESMHDRFFHWDVTALLTNAAARTNLQAHGALLRIDEDPYPPAGTQYWAAFTSSHDPAYSPPYQPRVRIEFIPAPAVPFDLSIADGAVSLGISNLTAGATNLIERSFDLTRSDGWTVVTSFTAGAGTTNWSAAVPPAASNVFYRVRSLP